jgi:hypothetical protein
MRPRKLSQRGCRAGWALLGVALLVAVSCVRHHASSSTGSAPAEADRSAPILTTQPAAPSPLVPPAVAFEDRSTGIRLEYPGDWQPREHGDYALRIAPAGQASAGAEITLDIPALPPHLPGMIPLGLVEKGYVDDLKQSFPGLRVEERSDHRVPGAHARLVRSAWQADGGERAEVALLMVHGDHVYILRLTGPAGDVASARPIFDQTSRSIRWAR